jgi:chromosome partitioning protein
MTRAPGVGRVQPLDTPQLVALASGKGGTGKTTLALALAHVLAEQTGAVAVLDLDPQAGLTDYASLDPVDDPLRAEPADVYGLTVYRGGRPLARAGSTELSALVQRPFSETAARWIVADLSPAWGDAAHAVVLARPETTLILAVKLDGGGLKAARELTALAESRGVPYRIVPTFGKRWALAQGVLHSLRGFYGDRVTDAVVPEDVKAAEAVAAGQPVTLFAPRSRAAGAVRDVAAELLAVAVR